MVGGCPQRRWSASTMMPSLIRGPFACVVSAALCRCPQTLSSATQPRRARVPCIGRASQQRTSTRCQPRAHRVRHSVPHARPASASPPHGVERLAASQAQHAVRRLLRVRGVGARAARHGGRRGHAAQPQHAFVAGVGHGHGARGLQRAAECGVSAAAEAAGAAVEARRHTHL